MLGALLACALEADDSGPAELPPDTESVDTAPDSFEVDSSVEDTAGDLEPEHTLALSHTGQWVLSPAGGPYTAMTGTLDVLELLDGNEENPACTASFALTGEAGEEACPGCSATFRVNFYLSAGALEDCQDPDLPGDGEVWEMGWNDSSDTILRNVGDTGVWLDWYAGERLADEISFAWSTTVGVTMEDDE